MGKGIDISGRNVVIRVSFLFLEEVGSHINYQLFWTAHKNIEEPFTAGVGGKWHIGRLNTSSRSPFSTSMIMGGRVKTRTVFGQLHRFGRFLIHPILGFVLRMCQEKHRETMVQKVCFVSRVAPVPNKPVFFSRKKKYFQIIISGFALFVPAPKDWHRHHHSKKLE